MRNIVITISRQYGSGGKTIGAMLAKELGINCYSREILRICLLYTSEADDQLSGAYCIFHASDHGGNSSCVCISDDSENTDEGHLCVCKEGPVFNINKLLWQI